LVETELAQSLRVDRAVIRGALARLSLEGLVEKQPNRGARVRLVSPSEAVEIVEARGVLEGLAARRVAESRDDRLVRDLKRLSREMADRLNVEDLLGYSDANGRIHTRILDASGQATVQRLVDSLSAQLVRYQYRTVLVPGRARASLQEHQVIVDAIAAGDGDRAERAMRRHLANVAETVAGIDERVPLSD
jgi:DNA-binding GntR family transcriptional regulator